MKTDLHTHSTASDGTLKPAELVTLADSCGVKLLALTDHDTVDGLPEAKSEAVKHGITFVPGIEVSTLWNERSIHVVGLGIRYEDGKLARVFADVAEKRVNRGKDIGKRLGELGFPDAYEGALRFAAKKGTLSRAHFARWMKMNGYVKTVQEAFDVYLGDGCPAFIKTVWPSLEEGISIILNAGGIPVLAHPGRYKLPEATPLSQLMKEFHEEGGLGIEVCSGSQRSETEAMLADFARQYGFYAGPTSIRSGAEGRAPVKFTLFPRIWILSGSIFRHLRVFSRRRGHALPSFLQQTAINFTQTAEPDFPAPLLDFSVP